MPSPRHRPLGRGDLVGLVEDGRPLLAVVLAQKGQKVDLSVGPSARPMQRPARQIDCIASLPPDRVPPLRLSQPPWDLTTDRLAACRPPERDFAAAWLLLREECSPLDLPSFVAVLADADDPAQRAACWQWLQGPQTFFRWRQGRLEARTLEDLRHQRRQRRRALLQERRRQAWHHALRQRRPIDPASLAAPQRQALELLRRLAAGAADEPLPEDLRRDLQIAHCQAEPGAIRHLLVDLGQWEPHHLPSLECTTWASGFSAELLAEADRLLALAGGELPGDAGRRDLQHQHVFSIDDDDTRDIDDALALERRPDGGLRLWIHVADPGRLVEAGSPLDLEACRRGASLYLARGSLGMFPERLATGPFSLRQGVRCAAWSLWVELDGEGEIAGFDLTRSWIRPSYRLSYGDADELIELAPPQERDPADLHTLLERRRRWRQRRGALNLEQAEGRIRCRDGEPQLEITEPTPSRRMVAEAMILAGAAVAAYGRRHQLPLPFRSQLPAELPPAAELDALPAGPVRHAAIRRCLSRGQVGTRPAPHFSLALDAYVQATSPIRRYGDLLVQRQLLAATGGGTPLEEPQLADLVARLEGPVKQGIQISREDQRHWQQVWFEHRSQCQWRAVFLRWLRQQDRLALVHADELAMDLVAHCPAASSPGDPLLLRVVEVDSLRDRLQLLAVA